MIAAQRQGRISFYLACTGEEASTIGSAAALEPQDLIMSQYREQGALAYRGYTTEQFMNQMFSNEKEPNKGRQMPIPLRCKRTELHDHLFSAGHTDPTSSQVMLMARKWLVRMR